MRSLGTNGALSTNLTRVLYKHQYAGHHAHQPSGRDLRPDCRFLSSPILETEKCTPLKQSNWIPGIEELKKTPAGRAYLERALKQFSATDRSADAVLPGPLSEAFADGSRTARRAQTLRPVTLGLVAILDRIHSPLLDVIRILREEMKKPVPDVDETTSEGRTQAHACRMKLANERMKTEIKADDESSVETVFCFLRPPAELRKLLAIGRQHFREVAMAQFGDIIHPKELDLLQQAAAGHYAASYATVISHEPGGTRTPGEGEVFTPPPAVPKTGSVGGLTS